MATCKRLRSGFVFLSIGNFILGVAADSCASFNNCDSCRNSSSLCHWCAVGECHAIGSPYGCVYGTYCYDNDKCQRSEPEYRGVALPSRVLIVAVVFVCIFFVSCAVSAILFARDYWKQNEMERNLDDFYCELSDESDEEHFQISRVVSYQDGGKPVSELSVSRYNIVAHPRSLLRKSKFGGSKNFPGNGFKYRCSWRLYRCTCLFCGASIIAAIAIGTLVLFLSPHPPVVNICNTEFDWGSVVHSMKKAQVEADFQILSSIYNPNFLNVEVESGTAVLRHKHIEVGQMIFEPFVAKGGYISDTLLTVEIDAEVWKELMLGYEYEMKTLSFFMDATVTASLSVFGMKTFPYAFSIQNYYIKASDISDTDRSLCNCAINTL